MCCNINIIFPFPPSFFLKILLQYLLFIDIIINYNCYYVQIIYFR